MTKHIRLHAEAGAHFTTDGWSDPRSRDVLGVTVHYIDANFVMHSKTIDVSHTGARHTSVNLRAHMAKAIGPHTNNKGQSGSVDAKVHVNVRVRGERLARQ